MIEPDQEREGLAWQTGVWNRISDIYLREIDQRFASVVEGVIARAALTSGESVLDLGTGTGAVALQAAALVGPSSRVTGVDISPDMLALAQRRASALGVIERCISNRKSGRKKRRQIGFENEAV